jgi:sigma-B regulation protein RsbU (phosphoserine phosphatase)
MAIPPRLRPTGTWRIAAVSSALAGVAYVVAGAAEIVLIRAFSVSESELAWVSDVVLSAAFGVAVYLWRHLRATRRALLERERAELVLNTQLAVAADLQRRLLPALPEGPAGTEWAASLRPAGQIGGDFYDVVLRRDGQVIVLVADVSGKGIPAAMALSTLRAAFRARAQGDDGPAQVLSQISAVLHDQWAGSPYLTGIVALVDVEAGTLRYACAAHPAGLVIGPSGSRRLESLGPPAALIPGAEYEERSLAVGPGDLCVLVSDGVTEALGERADAAIESIARRVAASGHAQGVCEAVMTAAMAGPGPAGVSDWDDDRTVVVFALPDRVRDVPGQRPMLAAGEAR